MGAFQNLFKMNVFLLMFLLPCGYFPIQYYVTITESIVHNNDIRLLRYCLLIIPVFIVFIRAFENVLGDLVKNIYIKDTCSNDLNKCPNYSVRGLD